MNWVHTKLVVFVYVCVWGLSLESSLAQETIDPEDAVTTQHQAVFNGQAVSYSATIGHQPVWDKDGNIIAGLNYTYYEKNGVKDKSHRPLLISFNGGPGSGSLWMEIGYTGPVLLNLDDDGQVVQPYGIHDNPYSVLDVADIVYICPVNTGFSRAIKSKDKKDGVADAPSQGASRGGAGQGRQGGIQRGSSPFFGVNEDIDYISDWVKNFINRQNRWESPKFIIGESYGTTRASGLAYSLQQKHWIFLNGVILLSPTELGIDARSINRRALTLPYMAATSWYHKALSQNPDLKVLVQSGYYDGGCDYFNAKYNFWQIDRGGKFQDRFVFKGYRSGHMIYVRQQDLKQGNEDIRQFILSQIPKDGQAIKY